MLTQAPARHPGCSYTAQAAGVGTQFLFRNTLMKEVGSETYMKVVTEERACQKREEV